MYPIRSTSFRIGAAPDEGISYPRPIPGLADGDDHRQEGRGARPIDASFLGARLSSGRSGPEPVIGIIGGRGLLAVEELPAPRWGGGRAPGGDPPDQPVPGPLVGQPLVV